MILSVFIAANMQIKSYLYVSISTLVHTYYTIYKYVHIHDSILYYGCSSCTYTTNSLIVAM